MVSSRRKFNKCETKQSIQPKDPLSLRSSSLSGVCVDKCASVSGGTITLPTCTLFSVLLYIMLAVRRKGIKKTVDETNKSDLRLEEALHKQQNEFKNQDGNRKLL